MSAIKYKTTLLIAALMLFALSLTAGADSIFVKPENDSWVTDTEGHINVCGSLKIDAGTPVTVMVAPQILSDGNDITAESVEQVINTVDFLKKVDYVETFTLGEDKTFNLSFNLNDSFPTGNGVILLGYNGGDGLINLGTFEHVGKDYVNNLVKSFNDGNTESYIKTIDDDIKGAEVLRKISANTTGYSALNKKDEFAQVLYGLKPESGFDAETLIAKFNEAVAWINLREADTLEVLKLYNEKYWSLPLAESDDLFILSETEQEKILACVGTEKYTDQEKLLSDFLENIALALFRSMTDRDSLTELMESEKYGVYFKEASEILGNSDLNEYYLIVAYNYVLEENGDCETLDEVNSLFEEAIGYAEDEKEDENKSGGSSSGGGGKGANVRLPENITQGPVIETTPLSSLEANKKKHPFGDVAKGHWAEEYIADMYEKGIISGIAADNFGAALEISRQDFVKIIITALGIDATNASHSFSDVEKGSYYESYVAAAVENGIISGTSEEIFGLGSIKREDVAVILARILESKKAEGESEDIAFEDDGEIADYAKEAVKKAAKCGLFTGDDENRFNPKMSLSRAEACALISRLLKAINA